MGVFGIEEQLERFTRYRIVYGIYVVFIAYRQRGPAAISGGKF